MFNRLKIYINRFLEVCSDRFLMWKYRNKPYIEYYRAVMKRSTKKDPKSAVGSVVDSVGERQLRRLKMHGMMPEHTLFDLGCGRLRGGIHMIKYLNDKNYTGNDISQDILEVAHEVLEETSLDKKEPFLYYTNDLNFDEVAGKTFDYLHAQSVLTHMPPEDIEELLKNISKIMHADSKFLTTFFMSKGEKKDQIYPSNQRRNFHYPFSWIKKCCEDRGLSMNLVEDDSEYIGKQTLVEIRLNK